MAKLQTMPPLSISQSELASFGEAWKSNGGRLSRTPPNSSSQLGNLFDSAVGQALSAMLGGIPIVKPTAKALTVLLNVSRLGQ